MKRTCAVWLLPLIAAIAAATADAAVPTQFIAKMYTEALGRAPDPQSWQSAVNYFQTSGCTQQTLESWGSGIFSSSEFGGLAYDDAATTLVLFRSILNREPDSSGFNQSYAALQDGQSLANVVSSLFGSTEFAQLVPYICSGNSYSFETLATDPPIAIPTPQSGGYGNLTEAQLQGVLNSAAAGDTVYLQQESVVQLTQPLIIPAGVTLATEGTPDPHHHALMARLVRAAPFPSAMILINTDDNPNPSGSVKNMWIDGERTEASAYVAEAVNIEIDGGVGATIDSNFIANSLGWSNVHTYGTLDERPCSSNTITNNVITAYPAVHAGQLATDGISAGCENSLISGNQIVDPTDVGIVVFTAYPATQKSLVTGNTIVSAGNSAYGALAFDPLQGRSAGAPNFTGASITANSLWSGPNTHFVIGLAVGSRPWYAQGSVGYGAEATNNTTAGIQTQFGAGIVVSGMTSATVQSNALNTSTIPQGWTECPTGDVLASVSAGLASGSIQSYADVDVNGCMSDYSPASSTSTAPTSSSPTTKASGSSSPQADTTTVTTDAAATSAAAGKGGGGGLGWLDIGLLALLAAIASFRRREARIQVANPSRRMSSVLRASHRPVATLRGALSRPGP